jgi:hypothetical protein
MSSLVQWMKLQLPHLHPAMLNLAMRMGKKNA